MKSTHTPGPWTAEELFNPARHRTTGRVFSNERHIADVRTQQDNSETDANARLIAAAPDLLAALDAFVCHHDDYNYENPADYGQLIEAARKAITKVQGGA